MLLRLHILLAIAAGAATLLASSTAGAFDYLEHSWVSDAGCRRAQQRLAPHVRANPDDSDLVTRYLALGLICPAQWKTSYCAEDEKQTRGFINQTVSDPAEGEFSVTLGDYAALPDHVSRLGPVRGLPRALPEGLVAQTLQWLADRPDSAGGTVEDVAEDACYDEADWETIEDDVIRSLDARERTGSWPRIPQTLLAPLVRARLPEGPGDPAAGYSIDNPHYLDLVLRNHTHFGGEAYGAWLGLHSASIATAKSACADILDVDADAAEDFADTIEAWEDADWDDADPVGVRRQACAMFAGQIRTRLRDWAAIADPDLVAPVLDKVRDWTREGDSAAQALLQVQRLEAVFTALVGLVLEGASLHYLQDGLASGHMRTIRSREALQEVRWDHDHDNRDGVVAITTLATGTFPWIAYGDKRLLGPPITTRRDCDFDELSAALRPDPERVATCLLQHQRGILVATTEASLVDWALGGTMFGKAGRDAARDRCGDPDDIDSYPCQVLPMAATVVSGQPVQDSFHGLHHGTLPVPPPPFSYESLSFRLGYEFAAPVTQLGLRMSFLADIDIPAHWLRSYDVGVATTLGSGVDNQWVLDFSYAFHFRWWARAMLDLSPTVFAGLRGFDSDETAFFAGIAPTVGITVLPEGWIKMPLELGFHYRFPMTFYGSDQGFFGEDFIDGHWLLIGVGLAFMH